MKEYNEIGWFHKVPLKDGSITNGQVDVSASNSSHYLFNEIDFKGKSVLDIGAWDGYFSFRSEQLGATKVVALDSLKYRPGNMDGFWWLHDHFSSKVIFKEGSIWELDPAEKFDVVLCYGVLYHINDPLTAMINCFFISNDLVNFEGMFFEDEMPWMYLAAPKEINPLDNSNIYCLSSGYVKKVAAMLGFQMIDKRISGGHPARSRGSILLKRISETNILYPKYCFSKSFI